MNIELTISSGSLFTVTIALWCGPLFIKLGKTVLQHFERYWRKRRLNKLKTLRRYRANVPYINYQSAITSAYLVMFCLAAFFFVIISYWLEQQFGPKTVHTVVVVLIAIPLCLFEILGLMRREHIQQLIAEHEKLLRYKRFRR